MDVARAVTDETFGDPGAGVGHEDEEDEEEDARERDAVLAEPDPDTLPVAARLDRRDRVVLGALGELTDRLEVTGQ